MNRDEAVARLRDRRTPWDMIVIGGGATGLGIALDAATRGYETLLLERDDFAQATSSRSTKLLHGGVRYLRQGNLKLVMGALRERGRVLANAPHLTSELPFIIPTYKRGESLYYGFGLGIYERLAGRASLGRSRRLNVAETRRELPGLRSENLRGGVLYHDGQFDDARLAVSLAQSAWDHGATLINYCQVAGLLRAGGAGTPVTGVVARDREHAARYLQEVPCRRDVLSVFAGLRPLVRAGSGNSTSALARDHLLREESGLVSTTGGKWTTYREMAEQTVDVAARIAQLPDRPCRTADLSLHGATTDVLPSPLRSYGSDAGAVLALAQERPAWASRLHPRLPYIGAEVVWAARHEMARSVQDVLARRTRALLLDARASIEAAPTVAALLAGALGRDAAWQTHEVAAFTEFALGYLARTAPVAALPQTPQARTETRAHPK